MTTVAEALEILDREFEDAPFEVADAWRIARGHVRRRQRPPSQTRLPAAVEEPITAKQHFLAATEELKKGSEPPKG
jgi:hypothetical protein